MLCVAAVLRAQQVRTTVPAISGQVVGPEGASIAQGSALLYRSSTQTITAPIDRDGRFRIVADSTGPHSLYISVPGLGPYRAELDVPQSRMMALPPIELASPTYLRVRLATEEGELLPSVGLRRRFIDSDAAPIADPLGHVRESTDADGTIVIGPLPQGRLQWAYDRPPLAVTRLPDVNVTGSQPMIDRGVIVIPPGRQLKVDVRSADGSPVPRHRVFLEDAAQPSPLTFPFSETNADGIAEFNRLPPTRMRVRTQTVDRCGNQRLEISRLVTGREKDDTPTRLVIGGRAVLRLTSPLGPIAGRRIAVSPDGPPPAVQPFIAIPGRPAIRPTFTPPSCVASTDADGRVTLAPFPPGPAQVRVSLFNSSFTIRVTVPERVREMPVVVPDGLIPVHVSDQGTQRPVGMAQVTWTGGGGRVEAVATANGDALLESAGTGGGTLSVSARGYQPVEGAFDETPGTEQSVALRPLPSELVVVRATSGGAPVSGVVIQMHAGGGQPARFAATAASGTASFSGVQPGAFLLSAHAAGFAVATVRVAENDRAAIVVNLEKS